MKASESGGAEAASSRAVFRAASAAALVTAGRDFTPLMLGAESVGHLWSYRDITDRVLRERRSDALLHLDVVSGASNRRGLEAQLSASCRAAARLGLL